MQIVYGSSADGYTCNSTDSSAGCSIYSSSCGSAGTSTDSPQIVLQVVLQKVCRIF
jgi:hypothetical protein